MIISVILRKWNKTYRSTTVLLFLLHNSFCVFFLMELILTASGLRTSFNFLKSWLTFILQNNKMRFFLFFLCFYDETWMKSGFWVLNICHAQRNNTNVSEAASSFGPWRSDRRQQNAQIHTFVFDLEKIGTCLLVCCTSCK